MKQLFLLFFVVFALSLSACTPKQPPVPTIQPEEPKQEPQEVAPKPEPPAPTPKPEPKPEPKPKPVEQRIGNLLLLGQTEYVFIEDIQKRLAARIDTGAMTSSLSATNIQPFERDGKKWIKFIIPYGKKSSSPELQKPIVRMAIIKRHGTESQERPVIRLRIRIGSLERTSEFTLTNRSNFQYPILIGRNVLDGKAAVDVSQKYLTSPLR